MYAIEFQSTIREDGSIIIPSKYKDEIGKDAKVILLFSEKDEITLRADRKRKSIQELFADYDGAFFQTEEIDWGKPQGNETW